MIPGVYREDRFPADTSPLPTGVPAFIGLVERARIDARVDAPNQSAMSLRYLAPGIWRAEPFAGTYLLPPDELHSIPPIIQRWPEFVAWFGPSVALSYVGDAVRGFFLNGGRTCAMQIICYEAYVRPVDALRAGLATTDTLDQIDLVCAPDSARSMPEQEQIALYTALLEHCRARGDRFALLDAPVGASARQTVALRRRLDSPDGALYFPWVGVQGRLPGMDGLTYVPPCGHIAGVLARSDERFGTHKAPANELLEGALDLSATPDQAEMAELFQSGVNMLQSFQGRGIRVWGARTLSNERLWQYISTRRVFLTAGRWIAHALAALTFEPNDPLLWARVERELGAYFRGMFQRGGLRGATAQEAFFVRCNAETNPPDARERGELVAEIGLAPELPNEFIVVRIIHGANGVSVADARLAS
jgi:phage tail sheath protein FI